MHAVRRTARPTSGGRDVLAYADRAAVRRGGLHELRLEVVLLRRRVRVHVQPAARRQPAAGLGVADAQPDDVLRPSAPELLRLGLEDAERAHGVRVVARGNAQSGRAGREHRARLLVVRRRVEVVVRMVRRPTRQAVSQGNQVKRPCEQVCAVRAPDNQHRPARARWDVFGRQCESLQRRLAARLDG